MNDYYLEILTVAVGLAIRLGIPILLTIGLSLFLKLLDKRWQAQAKAEALKRDGRLALPLLEQPHCWEIHNCPPMLRDQCLAYTNPATPCWELFQTNGNIKPACRSCQVPPPEIADQLLLV